VIYLDSAALVKLVREEDETRALVTWLNESAGQRLVASVLRRMCHRRRRGRRCGGAGFAGARVPTYPFTGPSALQPRRIAVSACTASRCARSVPTVSK
jgi:hypothetical protein